MAIAPATVDCCDRVEWMQMARKETRAREKVREKVREKASRKVGAMQRIKMLLYL
jgi:hypothetical protein